MREKGEEGEGRKERGEEGGREWKGVEGRKGGRVSGGRVEWVREAVGGSEEGEGDAYPTGPSHHPSQRSARNTKRSRSR